MVDMNLSTYACNTEELYFFHLLFYPKVSPDFQRHFLSQLQEGGYDIFELNAHHWLIEVNFRKHSESIFYMGIDQSLWEKGFKVPFRNWGYEVGVKL